MEEVLYKFIVLLREKVLHKHWRWNHGKILEVGLPKEGGATKHVYTPSIRPHEDRLVGALCKASWSWLKNSHPMWLLQWLQMKLLLWHCLTTTSYLRKFHFLPLHILDNFISSFSVLLNVQIGDSCNKKYNSLLWNIYMYSRFLTDLSLLCLYICCQRFSLLCIYIFIYIYSINWWTNHNRVHKKLCNQCQNYKLKHR